MMDVEELVHIIPLGHEFDRVVKPFDRLRANRVYLLTILTEAGIPYVKEKMGEKQKYFLEIVKKALEERNIEVIVEHTNIFDVLDVLKNVSRIIKAEKAKNNIVYVNMSGAGRLTSVAATLAAMAHGAKVYYVVADRYSKNEKEEQQHGLSICTEPKIRYIVNFQINLPDETSLKLLAELCKKEKGMKTNEIIEFLQELGLEEFDEKKQTMHNKRRIQQTFLIRLNKKILEKLEREGYITREKVGRYNTIKITEAGKYIAYISGLIA
jgi:hypothetical protein